jgi:Icc-related predicted phosphoesterase
MNKNIKSRDKSENVRKKLRIAAVGDVHYKEAEQTTHLELFKEIQEKADVLLLCGDLTDTGIPAEAHLLASDLSTISMPVIGVLGNHDVQSDRQEEVKKILKEAKMHILDGQEIEIQGVGFAGVKGFGGGFQKYLLSPFGETVMKLFAREAVNEQLKLENALSRLHTKHKVIILHYSPITDTIKGEPPEIYPFLGSSRLLEPIEQYEASVVFHGHADYGTVEGNTPTGIPVYNVALPLLTRVSPKKPYVIVEL